MTLGSKIDECLDMLNDKIEALKNYLKLDWEWDRDKIVGAKKSRIELTDEELEKTLKEMHLRNWGTGGEEEE